MILQGMKQSTNIDPGPGDNENLAILTFSGVFLSVPWKSGASEKMTELFDILA